MLHLRPLFVYFLLSLVVCEDILWEHPTGGPLPPGHPTPKPGGEGGGGRGGGSYDYMKYFYIMFYVLIAMFVISIITLIANIIMMVSITKVHTKLALLDTEKQKL